MDPIVVILVLVVILVFFGGAGYYTHRPDYTWGAGSSILGLLVFVVVLVALLRVLGVL